VKHSVYDPNSKYQLLFLKIKNSGENPENFYVFLFGRIEPWTKGLGLNGGTELKP
jgi:hypothetical protein